MTRRFVVEASLLGILLFPAGASSEVPGDHRAAEEADVNLGSTGPAVQAVSAQSYAACGGKGPNVNDCSSGGVLECCSVTLSIAYLSGVGLDVTSGTITGRVTTSSGTASRSCTILEGINTGCSSLQQSGTLYVGQSFTLSGSIRSAGALPGLGQWGVSAQSP